MSTRKAISGSFVAIVVLAIAQILARLVANMFVLIKVPTGICNMQVLFLQVLQLDLLKKWFFEVYS